MHKSAVEAGKQAGFRPKEYSPEKAGVGGSTPSLATIIQYPFVHRNRFQGLFSNCSMAFWMTVSRLSSCAIPSGAAPVTARANTSACVVTSLGLIS